MNAAPRCHAVLTGTGGHTPGPTRPIPPGSHFDAARPRQGPPFQERVKVAVRGMQTAVHSPASLDPTCSPLEPELSCV